ncbi:ketopantoate reductase [Arsukibacterium tuosuense]|uniref:2-dehydropantoate 2-reductase n=1 Tax=Arsukibacterium tuosuense TaxID=1323745 RepID=A0A285J980_9GAMM|nr:2-dehydropantoate 2-reductase [Arsukibacterium tuosuense]SNY55671.1 ketopantoate reductase [Arsukibacterium tuosuense]
MALHPSAQPALSWTIVGRGAIGLLAGARLQLAGYTVTLWLRQPEKLLLTFTDLKQHNQQLLLLPQQTDIPVRHLLVPVKANDVENAVAQLLPYLADNAQLIISHNGIIPFQPLLDKLKPEQGLWFLSTSQAAYKPTPAQVIHSGAGVSFLAKLTAASRDDDNIVAAMTAALGPLSLVADIYPVLWQKLAINVAINPLSAIENCQNGQLAAPRYQPQIEALVREVCLVATASGHPMDVASSLAKVYQVITATANNFSSMQQDVQAGRQTEIDAICGYVCQQAAQLHITVPANQQMLLQIKALTAVI